MAEELKDYRLFQLHNNARPLTIDLHKAQDYAIRALVWMLNHPSFPLDIFSYHQAHDLNFDILSVGYFGPGYQTHIYEYNYNHVRGKLNEIVDIQFLEEKNLTVGKVMYYFASQDIHIQLPPVSLSVSINLIIPKKIINQQFECSISDSTATITAILQGKIDFNVNRIN